MWPTSFSQAVSGPKSILYSKPGEEAALWRSPGFPNDVSELAWQGGKELDLIGGAGGVAAVWGQRQSNGVLPVWVELNVC
jgi:hypothetical protein